MADTMIQHQMPPTLVQSWSYRNECEKVYAARPNLGEFFLCVTLELEVDIFELVRSSSSIVKCDHFYRYQFKTKLKAKVIKNEL